MEQQTHTEWPETKRKLVDAGVNLMRSRGFNGTSLDNICGAAQVTKGGFFHYFKSKEEIAQAALAQFSQAKASALQSAPFRKLADPLDRVLGRLDFLEKSLTSSPSPKGCLIGMFAQELSFTNAKLRNACHESFSRMGRDLETDLAAAKTLHNPKAAFSPKSVAAFYVAILQGSLIMAKTEESNAVIMANLEHFRHYLEGLFPKARKPKSKRGTKPAAR